MNKKAKKTNKDLLVAGDAGTDRFIYLEGFSDEPPNLREAWVNAKQFRNITLDGGARSLFQHMQANGINVSCLCHEGDHPESIYLLIRQKGGQGWCIGKAIVAGEGDFTSDDQSHSLTSATTKTPCVILDFNQGWVIKNLNKLPAFLQERPYIIRTHDPLNEDWRNVRQQDIHQGIWFSPIQDMADGSLWFPGNWESVHKRVIDYLSTDKTIWDNGMWKHFVIVQVAYDGAIVVGPDMNQEGKILIFRGDQPGSFSREGYGPVLAGGIVFVHSIAEAIISSTSLTSNRLKACTKKGLARIRQLVAKGYTGPQTDWENWEPPSTTNLPVEALKKVDTTDIIDYSKPPVPNWQTACYIVCRDDNTLRQNTVLKLGKLITASPGYAHTLLRLTSRLENHINSDSDILSFSVFGGPGSGKSFVAKQIAKAIDPAGQKFEYQTFNISQFNDFSRLIDAFKQIQSISLKGKIPFIMWDEFDTSYNGERAGWLSSYLMPMQDAEFFDGTKNQKLGKCVFVFIGGTFKDDDEFNTWASKEEGKKQKGTDFHSRLDSSLTVPSVDFKKYSKNMFDADNDARLVRAIMIRAFLSKAKHVQRIAPDVLSFLLHIPLQHGVRSLEKIITASELRKTKYFQLFHLPALDVLRLHVDTSKLPDKGTIEAFIQQLEQSYKGPGLDLHWDK